VHDIRVEERRVLRNDSDALSNAFQLHLVDVLIVDEYSAGVWVIESIEKPQDCGFSASRGPYYGDLLAPGNGKGQVPEYRAIPVVAEADILEPDGPLVEGEWKRAGFVLYCREDMTKIFDELGYLGRWILFTNLEQDLHVEQVLPRLTIDGAQEVQRQRKLEYKLIDHDQVADGHRTWAHV
jgi:hypothetical protein